MKGTSREDSFTGAQKDMLSEARKWASASLWAPLLGYMEVPIFLRALLFRGIFVMFSREMQMPCKRLSLFIGTLLGNLERVHLPGFLREKKKYISVPSLDPQEVKILSMGAIWNFSKGAEPS